jgi:hypothetical protein
MSAKCITIFNHGPGRQHGAALMVMLVILIIGAAAILVTRLNSTTIKIARDNTTAEALAQARDALIGRAVSDPSSPGSLPCPDTSDDGSAELFSGTDCPSYIGRLPWKTLGLPDLRDGSGEELWYALSPSFRDLAAANPINSDTQGSLTINGTTTANSVVAIVFSAGSTLSGQSRSSTRSAACTTTNSTVPESLCATNYLELSNADPRTAASPNTAYQTGAASSTFNDRMITISHDQLFAPVETRIAREVKNCLDDYAADPSNTNHRYPWAASAIDSTVYPDRSGAYNVLFGRTTEIPNTSQTSGGIPPTGSLLTYIQNVQSALNNYLAYPTSSNLWYLQQKGDYLKDHTAWGTPAHLAGYTADNCNGSSSCTSTLQNQIDTAMGAGSPDTTMPNNWPASCTLFSASTYWPAWRDLVFYQVAEGYQPGGGTFAPLQINGSGNYRAAVIVGRSHNGSGSVYSNPPSYYLEGINLHDSTSTSSTISKLFETYSASDTSYSTVNDLVLCLDGAGTNPGSVCK